MTRGQGGRVGAGAQQMGQRARRMAARQVLAGTGVAQRAKGPGRVGLREGGGGQHQQHGLTGGDALAIDANLVGQEASGVVYRRISAQRLGDQFARRVRCRRPPQAAPACQH